MLITRRWLRYAAVTAVLGCADTAVLDGVRSGVRSIRLVHEAAAFAIVAGEPELLMVGTNRATLRAARRAAQFAGHRVSPASCFEAEAVDDRVTLTLRSCELAFGVLDVSGTVSYQFTVIDRTQLGVAFTTSDLTIGGRPTSLEASFALVAATYTRGGLGIMTGNVIASESGGGRPVSTRAGGRMAWSTACVDIVATATTDGWSASLEQYRQCGRDCPTDGILVLKSGESKVHVIYRGDGTAEVSTSFGALDGVPLECGAPSR